MDTLRIGLIYGSVRDGRFCDTVAGWAAGEIERAGGFALDIIDPRDLGLPDWSARRDGEGVAAFRERIDKADAFVVVTPEYNHAYPAVLKFMIDCAYAEWQAKPVAFVSYGGISGGLRAVEQLRLVFAELHAVTLRDTVSLAWASRRFDAAGRLVEPDQTAAAMAVMLKALRWWGTTLRQARTVAPYAAALA
jgi:NAD(P)H-dependent FMN reductase